MIQVAVSGIDEVKRIVDDLKSFVNRDYAVAVERGANKIANAVKEDMRNGMEHDSEPMAPLKQSTLDGPVHRIHNPTPRKNYGYVPLYATGALINDIGAVKLNQNEFEITAKSELGQIKLVSNAKSGHSGSPFSGDTNKEVRDPLQATDKRIDILYDELVNAIERVIGT